MSSDKERQKLLSAGYLTSKLKEAELLSRLESLHTFLKAHPQENERDLDVVAASLTENFLIAHQNMNLRLLVASCLVHIIRIYAPEAPYEAQELRRVFELFLSQLDGLSNPKSDSFKKVQDLLEKLVEVKAIVLLSQFEDLIVELFQKIFDIVSEEHNDLVVFLLDMLNTTIEFTESFPQEALEIILVNIVPGKGKAKNDQAVRLAQGVLLNTFSVLGNQITSVILDTMRNGAPESNTEFPAKVRDVIFHLQSVKPELLASVLPELEQELFVEDLSVRTGTVHLLAKLFSNFPHLHIDQYPLFNAFVKRFKDVDAEIRVVMIEFAKHMILRVDSEKVREDLSKELAERLFDGEEPVRLEAVKATVEIGTESNLDKLTLPLLLERLVSRMRDKSAEVRSEAISGLAQLWHTAHDKWDQPKSKKKSSSTTTSGWTAERRRFWDPLPAKILSCYNLPNIDDKVRVEDILNRELLKPSGGARQRATRLLTLVGSDKHCREIFGIFLKDKSTLRQDFIQFLDSDRRDETYARRKAAVALHFPGSEKSLEKIHDMNDEGLLKSLKIVAGSNPSEVSTLDKRVKGAIDAVERRFGDGAKKVFGGKGMKEFVSKMLVRLAIGFFDRESATELVGLLSEAIGNDDFAEIAKSLDLVEVLSKHLPSLFSGSCSLALVELLKTEGLDSETAERILHVLTNVSASLSTATSGHGGEELEDEELQNYDIKKPLSKFCISGTASQAKWAVRALVHSVADGVDTVVAISKRIITSHLKMEGLPKLSAYFATFKQIVKTNYDNLATELTEAAEFAMNELLPVSVDSPRGEKKASKKSSDVSQMIQAKVQAISFLVNLARALAAKVAVAANGVAAAPAKKTGKRKSQGSAQGDTETSSELIKRIIAILLETLQHKALAEHETEADRTQLRSSAARGLVRLARERYIEKKLMSLEVWYTLADILSESSNSKLRLAFAEKLVRAHRDVTKLPLKYLALLTFCAADADSKIAAPSKRSLQTCIMMRRKVKNDQQERILSHHESMASDAATLEQRVASSLAVLLPEYALPWLVHLIAHQPWFRNPGDGNGKKREARFAAFDRACSILHILIDYVSNGTDNFGFLRQMLLDIKQAEDAKDRRSDFVQEVAELADMLVKKREEKVLQSRGGIKHGDVPAKILLPAEIYAVPEVGSSQEDIQLRSAKKRYISEKYRLQEHASEHFKIGGAGPTAASSRRATGRTKKRARAAASDDEEEGSGGASSVEESSDMDISMSDSEEHSKKKKKKKTPGAKKGAAAGTKRRKTQDSDENSDEISAAGSSAVSVNSGSKKQTTSASPSQRGTPRRAAAGKAEEALQQQKAQTKQLKKREQEEDEEAEASSEDEQESADENDAEDDKMDVDSESEEPVVSKGKGRAKAASSAKSASAPAAKRAGSSRASK